MKLYFIAIVLKPDLRYKVKALKEEVKTRFGAKHALKIPAHITLQPPFKLKEEQVSDLLDNMESFAKRQKTFHVRLNGFDSFPPRVIFVKVVNHQPVVSLHNELVQVINPLLKTGGHGRSSSIHPHVTIASRDLRKRDFPDVWAEFNDREFKASFSVESIFLLKHNGKTWDLYREFFFEANNL